MQVTEWEGGVRCIALENRLDIGGVDAVEARFREAALAETGSVAVDMSKVTFVASLGLRMFVAVARALQSQGRRMVLFGCVPAVAEVFEMAALDDLFAVVPTEGGARARLGQ